MSSVNGIIEKINLLTDTHNTEAIKELKAIFGLEKLRDIRDFAMTIAFPSKLFATIDLRRQLTQTSMKLEAQ